MTDGREQIVERVSRFVNMTKMFVNLPPLMVAVASGFAFCRPLAGTLKRRAHARPLGAPRDTASGSTHVPRGI